ncbi:MAG: polysulfide reductase NrfD [candidate division KSB1 bacterium]|nr:polysulfide reductase NrfD [candidate division KSB1 bacterium]
MEEIAIQRGDFQAWVKEKLLLGKTLAEYIKSLFTPFNIVAGVILLAGLPLIVLRYVHGLHVIMNPSNFYPWGLFICFGLLGIVPLSATGYIMASAVYLFGLKEYRPLLRLALLTGFLGYFFAVVFIFMDIGRSWRLPFPMLVSYGPASVLFLVAWHVALYLTTQFVEFCPAIFEWLDAEKFRRWSLKVTIGATIFGVILSTLHQSALGALFLLMPGKVHPLWYSPYLPLFFFISSIFAGLSMIILVSTLSRRGLKDAADADFLMNLDDLTVGLGKAASVVLFTYFAMKVIGVAHGNHWSLLNTAYGHWFLVEMFLFVLLPCFLYASGYRNRDVQLIRLTSVLTIIGIFINRLNVSLIGFNWNLPHREFPKWTEYVVVITILTLGVLAYRWIVNRMPVLRQHPVYKTIH